MVTTGFASSDEWDAGRVSPHMFLNMKINSSITFILIALNISV